METRRDENWVKQERKLWDAMMHTTYSIVDSRKNSKILQAARKRGLNLKDVEKRHGMIHGSEASQRSWKAYRNWIEH